ncbi:CHAT domain-containing protein [Mycena polygramma]|nr:CHAT domain-containing protein [Mycena polygramma]
MAPSYFYHGLRNPSDTHTPPSDIPSYSELLLANMLRLVHIHSGYPSCGPVFRRTVYAMPMMAQLIVKNDIVKQSDIVTAEDQGDTWKLRFDCNIPSDILFFSITILRKNPPKTLGTRLLAHAKIAIGEALASAEQKRPFTVHLEKVNPDGPSLELRAAFSISGSVNANAYDLGWMHTPIRIGPIEILPMWQSLMECGRLPAHSPQMAVMHQRILLLPSTDIFRHGFLAALGEIEWNHYRKTNSMDALQQCICAYEDANRDSPGVDTYLSSLGQALWEGFQRSGDTTDLERSIALFKEAVQLSPDSVQHSSNLGTALRSRFQRFGNLGDLDDALAALRRALALLPAGQDGRPSPLHNLGNVLADRFTQLGDVHDINESVSVLSDAVKWTSADYPELPKYLTSLGASLHSRFERLGDIGDINHAISVMTEAARLSRGGPGECHALTILGGCLLKRFRRCGKLDDLNDSLSATKQAVKSCPDDHPQRADYLDNFGAVLRVRLDHFHDPADLKDAKSIFREVCQVRADDDPLKPSSWANLGLTLHDGFTMSGNLSELDDAIEAFTEGVRLSVPQDLSGNNANMLLGLSYALVDRFRKLNHPKDSEEAIAALSAAACSGAASADVRFRAALLWTLVQKLVTFQNTRMNSDLMLSQPDGSGQMPGVPREVWTESMPAYTVALDLMPELSWLGLSIGDRHHHLASVAELVRDAVCTAIFAGEYSKAVEWLEQGRSIIWSQILGLRTPLDTLNDKHPDLAERLNSLSRILDDSEIRATRPLLDGQHWGELLPTGQKYHEAAHARNLLLKQIRSLNDFDRFLLPKTLSELSRAAEHGPVVTLNISAHALHALVLVPGLDDDVLHIPLLDFRQSDAEALEASLKALLRGTGRGERLSGKREGGMPPEDEFAYILAELWRRIAKPVLNGLGYTTPPRNPQRMWWCMTGPLTFLPINAAGLYGEDDGLGSKLSDFVISSYTPSLTALLEASRGGSGSKELQVLAVSQPSAEGQVFIPGTEKEIDTIQRLAEMTVPPVAILRFDGNGATVDAVRDGMRESRWVHFACHGVQDVSAPTESALLLAGSSRLTLAEIVKMPLPTADLAFLSACQTATGAKELEEESVHLAAGMLSAGYRSVIATMWSIMDNDAPQVASDVYEHLFKTSPPDPSQAAEALHLAVKKLRDGAAGKKSFFNWVPFIHVGA